MHRFLAFIVLSVFMYSPLAAVSWSSMNIDKVTASAMTAAYEIEALEEGSTANNISKILSTISLRVLLLLVFSRVRRC